MDILKSRLDELDNASEQAGIERQKSLASISDEKTYHNHCDNYRILRGYVERLKTAISEEYGGREQQKPVGEGEGI